MNSPDLQDAQEKRLGIQGHFPYFIEEDRAAVIYGLKVAFAFAGGSGEGAFFVAE
jgi:hypothetical protein